MKYTNDPHRMRYIPMVLALPSKQIQAKSNPTTVMFRSAKILSTFLIKVFS